MPFNLFGAVVARDLQARGALMMINRYEVEVTTEHRRPEVDGYHCSPT
jgi:hypothetical protein